MCVPTAAEAWKLYTSMLGGGGGRGCDAAATDKPEYGVVGRYGCGVMSVGREYDDHGHCCGAMTDGTAVSAAPAISSGMALLSRQGANTNTSDSCFAMRTRTE